jgi:heterodisulfide reductase subunit A
MKSVAIIGGGIAGMEAAAKLSKQGCAVTIIEKDDKIGGRLNQWHQLFPHRIFSEDLKEIMLHEIASDVNLLTNAHITKIGRIDEGFTIHLSHDHIVNANSVLLTTGFDIFEAERKEEYGYGIYENVITSVELEQMFRSGKPIVNMLGKTPLKIGFIHCVGSRDEKAGNLHCSKVCCVTAVKQAIELKELLPASDIYLFYMDLRMFGRHFEELYKEAQFKHGIQFMRARLSEAFELQDGSIQIRIEDTLLSKPLRMTLDLLVLMVGIQSRRKKGNPFDLLKLERDEDGFAKMNDYYSPGKSGIPGLFLAGGINGPKTIEETLAEARAVTLEINEYLKNIDNFAGHNQYVMGL